MEDELTISKLENLSNSGRQPQITSSEIFQQPLNRSYSNFKLKFKMKKTSSER
jgi:hypothetical protein